MNLRAPQHGKRLRSDARSSIRMVRAEDRIQELARAAVQAMKACRKVSTHAGVVQLIPQFLGQSWYPQFIETVAIGVGSERTLEPSQDQLDLPELRRGSSMQSEGGFDQLALRALPGSLSRLRH